MIALQNTISSWAIVFNFFYCFISCISVVLNFLFYSRFHLLFGSLVCAMTMIYGQTIDNKFSFGSFFLLVFVYFVVSQMFSIIYIAFFVIYLDTDYVCVKVYMSTFMRSKRQTNQIAIKRNLLFRSISIGNEFLCSVLGQKPNSTHPYRLNINVCIHWIWDYT